VVLSHPVFEDAAGTNLDPAAALRELVEVSPVPVITGFDISIGSGTIGGNMYSLEQQARQAAQLALRILRGEADAAIPPPLNSGEGVFMFDHAALQRFDIPLSALPPGSVVVNQQRSAWELYRPQIVATVAGIVGLLLLVAFLLRLTRKLNQTRLTLAQLNENLEAQVQERTYQLHNANRKLLDEIGERKLLEDELQRHASTDVLTGISNRRHFLELIQSEIKHANRFDYPLALAMIDLDRFKQLNDRHGHAAGDTALIAFVEVCRHNIREIDLLARFGGDEFVLLMPNTDCDQAALVVEHVRKALEQHSLPFFSEAERLTISVGITTLAHAREPIETLLIRADAALYEAKAQGRNRIVIAAASVAAD
jgi:diguanylate cyclase (GGDEF)-like protein